MRKLTFRGGPLDGQTLDSTTKGIRNAIPSPSPSGEGIPCETNPPIASQTFSTATPPLGIASQTFGTATQPNGNFYRLMEKSVTATGATYVYVTRVCTLTTKT